MRRGRRRRPARRPQRAAAGGFDPFALLGGADAGAAWHSPELDLVGLGVAAEVLVGAGADRLVRTAARVGAPVLRTAFVGAPAWPDSVRLVDDVPFFVDHGEVADAAAFFDGIEHAPVALGEGPLFRVGVARHGDEWLVSTMWHHAIADAYTVGLCTRWLGELYPGGSALSVGADRWGEFLAVEQAAAEPAAAGRGPGARGGGRARPGRDRLTSRAADPSAGFRRPAAAGR